MNLPRKRQLPIARRLTILVKVTSWAIIASRTTGLCSQRTAIHIDKTTPEAGLLVWSVGPSDVGPHVALVDTERLNEGETVGAAPVDIIAFVAQIMPVAVISLHVE